MTPLARLIASVLYTGYCPVAPGTAGSAVAVIVYWLLPQQDVRVGSMVLVGLILVIWPGDRICLDEGSFLRR